MYQQNSAHPVSAKTYKKLKNGVIATTGTSIAVPGVPYASA
jgi:hypothetical protein